eukprot:11174525-Lingulodinium_polyedra.AAC.1
MGPGLLFGTPGVSDAGPRRRPFAPAGALFAALRLVVVAPPTPNQRRRASAATPKPPFAEVVGGVAAAGR